ncbi:MgtC/SapB family protein [Candidatus Peregrinibacteria bacterium]|jgi:uncharacterized membrane protein (DUF4010 family)|nr:MgtC/SapB family protein [Candidatus Peregrinibacteria bacterium]MBT7736904.1 MgtC/SapB family protein [Candidatus Peregrinibacteria bacterium]
MNLEILQQVGIAVVLSSLIGLEREQKYQKYDYVGFGGLRTFALIGLFGVVSQILGEYSPVYFATMAAGFFGMLIASYIMVAKNNKRLGATSEIASILVYLIGVLSGMEQYVLATSVALLVMTALHFKETLHKWASHLKNREIVSTIQFAVIAFVVLPLLPNEVYGPYGFFNPYIVWLMVVFISGISFASYIAIKLFGSRKGIGITGFLAGLISSTALTLSFSSESKKDRKTINPYVVAVLVASSAMFFRIIAEVAVLNRDLLGDLIVPIGLMGATGLLGSAFFWFQKEKPSSAVAKKATIVDSPFSLKPALQFGAFFALILFLTKYAEATMGDNGLYLTSLVSGIMDVDAITVSVANLAKNGLSNSSAVIAITIAALTNTFVKGGMFLMLGNKRVAVRIISVFALVFLVGVLANIFI